MTDVDLTDWLGRQESETVYGDPAVAARLADILDYQAPPAEPPLLWHWLLFTPHSRQSELDRDGHPRRGGFLPPIDLPRRMWAGGELEFFQRLQTAKPVQRRSTITDIQRKQGRSGELVFLSLQHEYSQADTLCVRERQDIVYRQALNASSPATDEQTSVGQAPLQTALGTARFSKTLVPDPTLLFRYSAATFNAHRIHYDRDYATGVEAYPALVVHGPLLATVLLDMLNQQGEARVSRFSFRAERPVFDGQPIHFTAHPSEADGNSADQAQWQLAVYNDGGQRCMQAQADIGRGRD